MLGRSLHMGLVLAPYPQYHQALGRGGVYSGTSRNTPECTAQEARRAMIWQDLVMGVCTVGFAVALVPQVLHGIREKHTTIQPPTAAMTAALMFVFALCAWTLGLLFYCVANVVTASLWCALAWQAWRFGGRGDVDADQ